MSQASTTEARATPPTTREQPHPRAVGAGRVDPLGEALAAVGEHLYHRPVDEHPQLQGFPAASRKGAACTMPAVGNASSRSES